MLCKADARQVCAAAPGSSPDGREPMPTETSMSLYRCLDIRYVQLQRTPVIGFHLSEKLSFSPFNSKELCSNNSQCQLTTGAHELLHTQLFHHVLQLLPMVRYVAREPWLVSEVGTMEAGDLTVLRLVPTMTSTSESPP